MQVITLVLLALILVSTSGTLHSISRRVTTSTNSVSTSSNTMTVSTGMLDSPSSMMVVMQLTSFCKVWRTHHTCLPSRKDPKMEANKIDLMRRLYRRNRRGV